MQFSSCILLFSSIFLLDLSHSEPGSKTWVFMVDGNLPPYSYLNKDQRLVGFLVDLVERVCEFASKNCRMVRHSYNECWKSKLGESQRGGKGLMSGHIDACPQMRITTDKLNTFSFTKPWKPGTPHGALFVKLNNPLHFDPKNVTGRTIGFYHGMFLSEHCLARQKNMIGANHLTERNAPVKHYQTDHRRHREALNSEEVDAFFLPLLSDFTDGFQMVGEPIVDCSEGGAVMIRKDSCLASWWDPAFDKIVETGVYRKLCNDAVSRYGSAVECFD